MTSKGYKHPPEVRARITAALKWKWRTDLDYRAKRLAALTAVAGLPENRKKSAQRMVELNKKLDRKKQWEKRRAALLSKEVQLAQTVNQTMLALLQKYHGGKE